MTARAPQDGSGSETSNGIEAFIAFQNLTPDGFMMFRPVRNDTGDITDLEWTFVNAAAGKIIDRQPAELIGKNLLVEMPGNKDEGLFDAYVQVIETGKTWQREFHYDHGGIRAWFRTTAAKAGEGLALSFADISEVRRKDERLRDLMDGVLAFVGVLSVEGTLLEANEPAVAAAGVSRDQLIGVPFWDCFWWNFDKATQDRLKQAVQDAARGERIRYDAEIRIAGDQRLWIDFQIVPVFNSSGEVTELIPSGVDITERKLADSHREFLVKELSHRVKNTLATIQSMAGQTMRTASSMEDFEASFKARLRSIAASHDLLVAADHRNVSLTDLVRDQVLPYAASKDRLVLDGDDFLLPDDRAYSLGLILHELATNAAKYGALSREAGVVSFKWHVQGGEGSQKLTFNWMERGGPPVKEPTRRGFGTRLIERSLAADEDEAVFEFSAKGLSCVLKMVLR